MKVVDIAQEIYFDLNSPSDLSIAAIAFWIRANVGRLNSIVFANFALDNNYEIVDADDNNTEIDINAAAILKKMYIVHRYSVIIRSKLTAIDSDDIVEVTDQDQKVRKLDKTQIVRAVTAEKKIEEEELQKLINAYRTKKSNPVHVVGDDIVAGQYPDVFPYIRSGRTYGYTAY
jgi:hypothetical protein